MPAEELGTPDLKGIDCQSGAEFWLKLDLYRTGHIDYQCSEEYPTSIVDCPGNQTFCS